MEGESNKRITKSIEYRLNTGYSEQFWYTSVDGSTTELNTILFFKQVDSEEWEYEEDDDLMRWSGTTSTILEQQFGNWLTKVESSTVIKTFLSCNYNYKYNTIDDSVIDEDLLGGFKYNDTEKMAWRNCTKCPEDAPFSYGFQETECKPCEDFAEGFLANAHPYI